MATIGDKPLSHGLGDAFLMVWVKPSDRQSSGQMGSLYSELVLRPLRREHSQKRTSYSCGVVLSSFPK
jgi:hypothetical protein